MQRRRRKGEPKERSPKRIQSFGLVLLLLLQTSFCGVIMTMEEDGSLCGLSLPTTPHKCICFAIKSGPARSWTCVVLIMPLQIPSFQQQDCSDDHYCGKDKKSTWTRQQNGPTESHFTLSFPARHQLDHKSEEPIRSAFSPLSISSPCLWYWCRMNSSKYPICPMNDDAMMLIQSPSNPPMRRGVCLM